jgi:hypothetical protein
MTDAAGRRVDEDALAGLHSGGINQGLPRGKTGQGKRSRVDMIQAGWFAGELPGRPGNVLSVGAGLLRE